MTREAIPAGQAIAALFQITGNIDCPGGLVPPAEIMAYSGGWGRDLLPPEQEPKRLGLDRYRLLQMGFKQSSPDVLIETMETGVPYEIHGAHFQTTNGIACMGADPHRVYNAFNKCDFIAVSYTHLIGVNVEPPDAADAAAVGGKNVPVYLPELGFEGNVDDVAAAVLHAFAPLYRAWLAEGFAPLAGEYAAHASLTGRSVRMVNRAGEPVAEGTVASVDAFGRLVLRASDGSCVPVASGEAHLV